MTEGGVDPHRDDWVPVPLRLKKYDPETKTYVIEFEAPKQLLLNGEFEAMVHDELLRHADRDGLIIEGQVVVTHRDRDAAETVAEPADPDAATRDVLLHPEKEAEVEIEQDAIESPYKMSKAEMEYRQRMRQNLRETAEEAFGFVAGQMDGTPLPEGKQFKVDRDAFMQGFHGEAVFQRPMTSSDFMVVRAEALVVMSLGATEPEPGLQGGHEIPTSEDALDWLDVEIPDDLSGLDG